MKSLIKKSIKNRKSLRKKSIKNRKSLRKKSIKNKDGSSRSPSPSSSLSHLKKIHFLQKKTNLSPTSGTKSRAKSFESTLTSESPLETRKYGDNIFNLHSDDDIRDDERYGSEDENLSDEKDDDLDKSFLEQINLSPIHVNHEDEDDE